MEIKRLTKILVVEDDGITATAIEEILTLAGYFVVGIAPSGQEALEQVASLEPDLVLMDIRLKGPMDGVTVTQHIRARRDIPVVYLTALSDDDTLKRIIHSQPYGYIVKPFTEEELCGGIEMALRQHRRKQGLTHH